ncbi:ATP-binding protein [Magnetospira sp. QH-2]|uniref:sensor histidine kinase n=1 Tax=Magnetospira sp. (strain QH-2) TaxID=1288970 RepID=UPI0003E8100D|nr:ATP-binding protein [Magnetospira sp. QH-2]CCQ75159.1 putative Histidine kinase with PAS sensor domain [Magnetospira sp. QH-2]
MKLSPAWAALIGILTVLTLLVGVVYIGAIHQVRTILEDDIQDSLRSDLLTLEQAAREMLLKHHYENVESMFLDWAERTAPVSEFVGRAPNGFAIATFNRPTGSLETRRMEHRILHEETLLLTLSVTYDLSSVDKRVKSLRILILAVFPVSVLFLGGILWETVRRSALVPMERAQKDLRRYQDHLESMVEERTHELEDEVRIRSQAEEALRNHSAFLDTLLEAVPAPVFFKNDSMVYIGCNRAFENFIGMDRNDILQRTVFEIAPPDLAEIYHQADQALFDMGGTQVYEASVKHQDGRYRDVIFHKAVFQKANGEPGGIIGLMVDISDRKNVERDLAQRTRKLEWSNAELKQFAYVTSHDLQEPLRTVSSYLQLLQNRYGDDLAPEAHEFMDFAIGGASRMSRLINDLLAYSRITTHPQDQEQADLNHLLENALANLTVAIDESDAKVTHDDLPTTMGDPGQLSRLLQNLIGNAIKYRDPDRSPAIHIEAKRGDGEWILSVSDNGIGIDSAHFHKIFQIFQRLHQDEEYGGTGIGLAICKRIVERHGGRIWVDSEPGCGSTFCFSLPDENQTFD